MKQSEGRKNEFMLRKGKVDIDDLYCFNFEIRDTNTNMYSYKIHKTIYTLSLQGLDKVTQASIIFNVF